MSAALPRAVLARLVADPAPRSGALGAQVRDLVREHAPLLPEVEVEAVAREVLAAARGLGALEPLLADGAVTEVMVNPDGRVYVERAGRLAAVDVRLAGDEALRIVERFLAPLGLRLDRASPLVDARLPDGSRLHAAIPPVSPDGPCVTIRRFARARVALDAFGAPDRVRALLHDAVVAGRNVLVSGGTSAGKTTLLGALAAALPPEARVVTIEETAELRLAAGHVVRLESRPANAEGAGEIPVRALVRAALRMRPDRIVIGEVRGAEAFDLLQASNTGHHGSLSSVHANSPSDALARLEALTLLAGIPIGQVREQWLRALDLVVHVARAEGGSRRIVEVAEVVRGPDSHVSTLWSAHR